MPSSKQSVQRSRSKSHSPQNSNASIYEPLVNRNTHGHAFFNHEAGFDGVDHRKRSRFMSWFYSQMRIRSLCLLVLTVLCIAGLILQSNKELLPLRSLHLRRNIEQCPIAKWDYPNCKPSHSASNKSLAPLTPRQWYDLRTVYHRVMGELESSLDPSWDVLDPDTKLDGFQVPVEVRDSPGKGRGVFLMEPVTKGQRLWDNRYTARFPDECTVRRFFASIGDEAACDAIMWGYVNNFYGHGLQFQLDLDPSVFLNEANSAAQANTVHRFPDDLSNEKALRVVDSKTFFQRRREPGAFHAYAKEDIPAGTELVFEYSDVHLYAKLFWYEKLCLMTRGVVGWLFMQ